VTTSHKGILRISATAFGTEDIKLSTLEKVAAALGKRLRVKIA